MKINQLGFTIVESLIAMSIVMIAVTAVSSSIVSYNKMQGDQKAKLGAKTLITQVASDLAAAPQRYPTIVVNGGQVGYVLCFDQQLAHVPFSSDDDIGYVPIDQLEPAGSTVTDRPSFCTQSRFEVRIMQTVGDPELRIEVYQTQSGGPQGTCKRLATSSN